MRRDLQAMGRVPATEKSRPDSEPRQLSSRLLGCFNILMENSHFRALTIFLAILIASCSQGGDIQYPKDSSTADTSTLAVVPTTLTSTLPITVPTLSSKTATPTRTPWTIRASLSGLPESRLYYEIIDGIYQTRIGCRTSGSSCISDPILVSTGSIVDHVDMEVSPDGNLIAISRIDAYGSLGLQSSVRMISVEDKRTWSVGLMGTQSPNWSPDGSMIAYVDYLVAGGEASRICISTPTEPIRCFSSSESLVRVNNLLWSPDGRSISYCQVPDGYSYYICDLNLLDLDSRESHFIASGVYINFAWSPDGSTLFFNEIQDDSTYDLLSAEISACLESREGCIHHLGRLDFVWGLEFSPDGSYASYFSSAGFMLMPADCVLEKGVCSPTILLHKDSGRQIEDYSWSPDSRFIAYTANSGRTAGIFLVAVDGSGTAFVEMVDKDFSRIDWRPAK